MVDDPVAAYAEALIRSLAAQMVDPHRYFEQRLRGELSQCRSAAEREAFLARLIDWLNTDLLDEAQLAGADALLAAEGWPAASFAASQPAQLTAQLTARLRDRASR